MYCRLLFVPYHHKLQGLRSEVTISAVMPLDSAGTCRLCSEHSSSCCCFVGLFNFVLFFVCLLSIHSGNKHFFFLYPTYIPDILLIIFTGSRWMPRSIVSSQSARHASDVAFLTPWTLQTHYVSENAQLKRRLLIIKLIKTLFDFNAWYQKSKLQSFNICENFGIYRA